MNWDQAYPPSWAKDMDKPGSNTSALLSWHSLGVLSWRHKNKKALYQSINQNQVAFFHSAIRSSVAFIQLHCSKMSLPENHANDEIYKNTMSIFDHFPIFLGQFTNCEYESIDKNPSQQNRQKPSFSNTVNVTRMSCLPTKRLRAHVGSISFLSDGLPKWKSPAQHHKAKKWNSEIN